MYPFCIVLQYPIVADSLFGLLQPAKVRLTCYGFGPETATGGDPKEASKEAPKKEEKEKDLGPAVVVEHPEQLKVEYGETHDWAPVFFWVMF